MGLEVQLCVVSVSACNVSAWKVGCFCDLSASLLTPPRAVVSRFFSLRPELSCNSALDWSVSLGLVALTQEGEQWRWRCSQHSSVWVSLILEGLETNDISSDRSL